MNPVVAFEVVGTNPIPESLESVVGSTNFAYVKEIGRFKLTRGCVPGSSKGLCSIPATPFWEGGGRVYVDSLWVYVEGGFQTPKDTSEE